VAARGSEAVGTRELAGPPRRVWQAVAVLQPYCAVCDVSYRVTGRGRSATFVCLPGRVEGGAAVTAGTRGEILEWHPPRRVTTRLELAGETWTTRLELTGTGSGGTRVEVALRCEPDEAGPLGALRSAVQHRSLQRLAERTLAVELDRLPGHLAQLD
jgi:hypothetical protein